MELLQVYFDIEIGGEAAGPPASSACCFLRQCWGSALTLDRLVSAQGAL